MTFRVRSDTKVDKLSGAIFTNMKNSESILLSCVGTGALNQAIKSFITAKGLAYPRGMNLVMDPYFSTTCIDGNEITVIEIKISKGEI